METTKIIKKFDLVEYSTRMIVFGVLCQMMIHRLEDAGLLGREKQKANAFIKNVEYFLNTTLFPLFGNDKGEYFDNFVASLSEFETHLENFSTEYIAAVLVYFGAKISNCKMLLRYLSELAAKGNFDAALVKLDAEEFLEYMKPKAVNIEIVD